jgi:hypothetical protein
MHTLGHLFPSSRGPLTVVSLVHLTFRKVILVELAEPA